MDISLHFIRIITQIRMAHDEQIVIKIKGVKYALNTEEACLLRNKAENETIEQIICDSPIYSILIK